jgi:hypothetical protein
MCDVGVDEVDGHAGSAGLGAGLLERLGDEVNPGDVPSVLGQVDRRISRAASDVQRRFWLQRRCVSGSLDQLPQPFRVRMTVPRDEAEPVKDPEQVVSRSHDSRYSFRGR